MTIAAKPKAKPTAQQELLLQQRATTGSRPIRRMRQDGLVPGVVYGKGMETLPVAVKARDLVKLLRSKRGEQALVTLRREDAKNWEKPALVKAVQHDPVDGHVVHVDFQTIVLTERLRVKVPVVLIGDAVGVKQEGGVLEHFLREVEVECLPTEIPAQVEADASAMKIGDTLHVRDLVPPKRGKITADPEGAIASVQKPKEEKPDEAAAAAAVTEPEVLREKKEEPGAAAEEATGAAPEAKKEKDKEAKT